MALTEKTSDHLKEHHRSLEGGGARAAVFGMSDGLVSNVSLILGMAGASSSVTIVRAAGVAGLIAGAFSMAAGEYVSVRAQRELFERELQKEESEHDRHPEQEKAELVEIYESRGMSHETASKLAEEMSATRELAIQTHVREEMGVDPDAFGNPIEAMLSSFVAFSIGALIPLIPWFFASDSTSKNLAWMSVIISSAAAFSVGWLLAQFTGRSKLWSATRQLLIAGLAATVTFAVGSIIGGGTVA